MGRIFGFGAERIALPPTASRDDVVEQRTVMLARCLNLKTTVAFVGSGCSLPLGYPGWVELVRGAIEAMQSALAPRDELADAADRERLGDLTRQTASPEALTADHYLVILGECQRISKRLQPEGDGPYEIYLRDTFDGTRVDAGRANDALNPHLALMKLPIYRFVTTNYDFEIERAICSASARAEPRLYGLEAGGKRREHSFTQSNDYVKQLSEFVLYRRREPRTVFHCHGDFTDPKSIVSTERDYQQWYLREDLAGLSFRQNLALLFGSNPIFFVGFGMRDYDLLHALRILHVGDRSAERPRARTLFALLPETGDAEADRLWDDLLFERYQVNVISYDPRAESTFGASLCRRLSDLKDDLDRRRHEFLAKPAIRKVVVPAQSPEPYLHYAVARGDDLAPERTHSDLRRLTELVEKKSMIVVHGYGGSGKSWRVLQLIDEVRNRRVFGVEGIFFWSSYYADDWLTGVDRALEYFGSRPQPRRTRVQRLLDCLSRGRHLLVFDGFERLLRDRGAAAEVAPASQVVIDLLDAGRDKTSKSVVILTTRLMPDMLKNDDRVAEFSMRRATTAELAKGNVFRPFIEEDLLSFDDLAAVCSLCDGHSYALALAAAYLRHGGSSSVRERMTALRLALSDVSPARRLTAIIQLAVDDVDKRADARAIGLLRRIALFMSPVIDPMLDVCAKGEPWRDDVRLLLDANLLFRVSTNPESADAPRGFVVHPTVRNYMLHESASEDPDLMPNFTLPGYTSGSTPVHPGTPETVASVRKMFGDLLKESEAALDRGEGERARRLCRGAFGLVRSRMETNSICRWTTYDDYLDSFALPLAVFVKRVAPDRWDYMDRSHAPDKERTDAPLFADELAWLWNDIGLAYFSQGAMTDSHAVFELSYEIDRVTDSYDEGGQYLVQSRLHMAAVFIQMGKLNTAAEYLEDTEESNRTFRDEEYAGRITGYKALLAHLRGNADEADDLYTEAVERLRRNGPNLRGRSIFTQHHADLKMSMGDLDAADRLVRTSRALAEEGKHVDLVAYARNSGGHLLRLREQYHEAHLEYEAVLAQARKSGTRGLESDARSELGRLALMLGDWETARHHAVASLRISNELWLGLRSSHGLVLLGLAMIAAKNRELGAAYLHQARKLARQQGYLLRVQEAEKELRNLGEIID